MGQELNLRSGTSNKVCYVLCMMGYRLDQCVCPDDDQAVRRVLNHAAFSADLHYVGIFVRNEHAS